MNTNIEGDFQICISVPLRTTCFMNLFPSTIDLVLTNHEQSFMKSDVLDICMKKVSQTTTKLFFVRFK